jgi:hypothetical protein
MAVGSARPQDRPRHRAARRSTTSGNASGDRWPAVPANQPGSVALVLLRREIDLQSDPKGKAAVIDFQPIATVIIYGATRDFRLTDFGEPITDRSGDGDLGTNPIIRGKSTFQQPKLCKLAVDSRMRGPIPVIQPRPIQKPITVSTDGLRHTDERPKQKPHLHIYRFRRHRQQHCVARDH